MKLATFLRDDLHSAGASQSIYRLSPPYEWEHRDWDDCDKTVTQTVEFVWVSAIPSAFHKGPETFIFAAKENGETFYPLWPLPGSFQGGMNHTSALHGLGYLRDGGPRELDDCEEHVPYVPNFLSILEDLLSVDDPEEDYSEED